MVGALKCVISLTSQGLGAKVIHTRSQPSQHNQPTIKILDTEAWVTLPGQQNTLYVLSQITAGRLKRHPHNSTGRGQMVGPSVSQTLPFASFSIADLTLYPLVVTNHNHQYDSFSEFWNSFQQITEPEEWSWGHPNTLAL